MAQNEITATKGERSATVYYDFGGSLDAAKDKFGAEVVYSSFVRTAVITAQSIMRRMIEQGAADEKIAAKLAAWVPGIAVERVVDPIGSTVARFKTMSAEEQEALIAKLLAQKA